MHSFFRNHRKSVLAPVIATFALSSALATVALGQEDPAQQKPTPGRVSIEALAENAGLRPLAVEAAEAYRAQARYPEHSKALEAGSPDPIRDERAGHPVTVRSREKADVSLSVRSEQLAYTFEQTVLLYAELKGAEARVITGELVSSAGETVARLRFFDDGVAPDLVAGDGIYTVGTGLEGKARRPELADNYMVRVTAIPESGEALDAVTGFVLSNPGGALTGAFRSSVVDGSLVIEGEVEVERAGRFHLAGVLHTRAGEAIGTAQAAARLEPGRHWLALPFYGLMFHDRAVEGPYRLGSVTLTTTGAMPNALGPVLEDVHLTRPLKAAAFTAEPYGDPALLDAALRLEAQERARLEK